MEEPEIREYAQAVVRARLGVLAAEIGDSDKRLDADTIHDMRVAVRRFMQSLTVFHSLLPEAEVCRILRRLKKLMEIAGDIRNRDIALEFLKDAGLNRNHTLWRRIDKGRKRAEKMLTRRVQRWRERQFADEWRAALEAEAE